MGFHVNESQFDAWLTEQSKTHDIYAPKCFAGGNTYSDVDCIRYGKVNSISEIVFDKKSEYAFKEVLTPISVSGTGDGFVDLTIRRVGKVSNEVFGHYVGDAS